MQGGYTSTGHAMDFPTSNLAVLGKILFKTILKIQDKDTFQEYLEDIR